jgi:hypothetical protein
VPTGPEITACLTDGAVALLAGCLILGLPVPAWRLSTD